MRRRGLSWLVPGLLAVGLGGCPQQDESGSTLPARESGVVDLTGFTRVARLAHITDTHVVDTLSPARFTGAAEITRSAWRPYEAYATQIVDGMIRTVNRVHAAGRTIDFLLHTGDGCDNVQSNELAWLLTLMDGGRVDPLSGPDDRPVDQRPAPTLDPYAAFDAQGLYRSGTHGELPSIPWYAVPGNHDVYAIGLFAIFEDEDGHRTAPLPLDTRPGLLLPVRFDPLGSEAHYRVTPADPGPPALFEPARYVAPNPARAYFSKPEYVQALGATTSGPRGHGFDAGSGVTWYSAAPVTGLRPIGLDTTDRAAKVPGFFYDVGALSRGQLDFLRTELEAATARGEIVIVASHHPSAALSPSSGSEVSPEDFRALLNAYPAVVLHLCGHSHRNRVTERGGYIEVETCSTLDLPQEGRLVEIWRDGQDGRVAVVYEMFSDRDDALPALGADPLRALREQGYMIALGDKGAVIRQRHFDPEGRDPRGDARDREGVVVWRR